uniref:Uncharacterized protein n=1 Tax=Trichogramma kaykai TaxID=54128 RepID=A0ABD2X5Q7_9HYME
MKQPWRWMVVEEVEVLFCTSSEGHDEVGIIVSLVNIKTNSSSTPATTTEQFFRTRQLSVPDGRSCSPKLKFLRERPWSRSKLKNISCMKIIKIIKM